MKQLTRRAAARLLAAAGIAAMTAPPAAAAAADPIFELIADGEAARKAYRQERARVAGLPDGRTGDKDHWEPWDQRIWDTETAVVECQPATAAGFAAKVRFLASGRWNWIADGEPRAGVSIEVGKLSPQYQLFRLSEDATRLLGKVK